MSSKDKLSPKNYLVIIQEVKDNLKNDDVFLDLCKEYDFDPDDIDLVPVKFGDIDVSATTERGVITLNWNLLKPENRKDIPMYLLHEVTHYCQQASEPTQSADDGDYLKNPSEIEAFKSQISFIDEHQGADKAEEYTDQVLDHHDAKGKDRANKKEKLLENIEAQVDLFLHKTSRL